MDKLKQEISIQQAKSKDFDSLLFLINSLADYEKLERPDELAQGRLKNDLFGSSSKISTWLARIDEKAIGYAITLFTYSSFLALPTLYLEDLFVLPEYRSKGIGKELFKHCAKVALENNCGRMEWQVLDWNQLAIDFYEKIGAKQIKEWLPYRFTNEELKEYIAL